MKMGCSNRIDLSLFMMSALNNRFGPGPESRYAVMNNKKIIALILSVCLVIMLAGLLRG